MVGKKIYLSNSLDINLLGADRSLSGKRLGMDVRLLGFARTASHY